MSDLTGLLYYSFCDDELDTVVLRFIMERARIRNQRKQVTGQLHFENGLFLQWIEGAEKDIDDVFGYIQNDPHHGNIQIVKRNPIPLRQFTGWDMAFSNNENTSLLSFMSKNGLSLEDQDDETAQGLVNFLNGARLDSDQSIAAVRWTEREPSVTREHYKPSLRFV